MNFQTRTFKGITTMALNSDAPMLTSERDLGDYIGDAWVARADWLIIPLDRLAASVLDLKSGLLGEMLQKLVNYKLGVAFIGDIRPHTQASKALNDFVLESNQGRHVWFLDGLAYFERRLPD
jgi:hypothetical protein